MPYGAVEIRHCKTGENFKVNRHRLKRYIEGAYDPQTISLKFTKWGADSRANDCKQKRCLGGNPRIFKLFLCLIFHLFSWTFLVRMKTWSYGECFWFILLEFAGMMIQGRVAREKNVGRFCKLKRPNQGVLKLNIICCYSHWNWVFWMMWIKFWCDELLSEWLCGTWIDLIWFDLWMDFAILNPMIVSGVGKR